MLEVSQPVRLTKLTPIVANSIKSSSDIVDSNTKATSNHGRITSVGNSSKLTGSQVFHTPEVISSAQSSYTVTLSQLEAAESSPATAIDPISRQIFERTRSHHSTSRVLPLASSEVSLGHSQKPQTITHASDFAGSNTLQRNHSLGSVNRTAKEKRKGVSIFSRFIGNKRKDAPGISRDDTESIGERLPVETEAEVFSRPIGFVPQFPAPPRYVKVKANHRKSKEFERLFLAQVLLERRQKSKRKTSGDEEIVHIDDVPASPGQPFSKAIWAMEFSKDGRYLAAAGQDKKVRIWAVISSNEEREAHEAEEEEKVPENTNIRLNGPVLRTKLIREYQGHTSSILDLCWSKNNFLLSSSMDKTVRLWHISRSECLCAFKHHDFVTSIAFHPRDDRFFLAGSLDTKLRLWSIPDKSVAYWVNVPDMVTAVAFTPDGKTCIAGCLNGLCLFYDTEKLKIHSQLHVRSARGRNAKGSKITGIDTITLPSNDPNGDTKLLITSNDSRVRMYNYKDRNLEIKFRGNENTCSQIHATFSDDGRYVICGSEDKRVYIWPTGPTEKQDQDKRPVEILEAHSAIVTSAILAPTKARQLLAQSGDPIYDLCNPPPVTLMGIDSGLSSRAPTESSPSIKDQPMSSAPSSATHRRKAEETPAYLARHAHPGGNIIVTADYLGQIKIFRQDCAFQKRRYEFFDSASLFSKSRLLRRSGSATTRTSLSSARNSTNFGNSKNPSTDHIINWRNSITSGSTSGNTTNNPVSTDMHPGIQRARSNSPRKLSGQTFAPRHQPIMKLPLVADPSSTSSHMKSSNDSTRMTGTEQESVHTLPIFEVDGKSQDRSIVVESEMRPNALSPDQDDSLLIQGDHSYRYWRQENLAAMAQREPRSPGLLDPDSNPLSRKQSMASRLGSEVSSDETAISEPDKDGRSEINCKTCGNRSFRVTENQTRLSQENA